jgi:ribonucleoside-diphosphate reductase alpha chain
MIGTYTQAPFEDITEKEFNKRVKLLNDVKLFNIVETTDETDLSGELACAGGSCEITGL